jgi:antitoxin component of MazEF toxin-antitoxin module
MKDTWRRDRKLVRLQRQKAYVYTTEEGEEIQHFKHMVTIPEDTLQELGWKQGVELHPAVDGGKLILEPERQIPDKQVKSPTATDITPKGRTREGRTHGK